MIEILAGIPLGAGDTRIMAENANSVRRSREFTPLLSAGYDPRTVEIRLAFEYTQVFSRQATIDFARPQPLEIVDEVFAYEGWNLKLDCRFDCYPGHAIEFFPGEGKWAFIGLGACIYAESCL